MGWMKIMPQNGKERSDVTMVLMAHRHNHFPAPSGNSCTRQFIEFNLYYHLGLK
jgi:hypothetical protein